MWTSISPRRLVRDVLAILFAASTTTCSVLWVIENKHTTPQPGFTNYEYSTAMHTMNVGEVIPGSPAEQAGLRAGDRIFAIDGQELETLRPFYDAVAQSESIELTVDSRRTLHFANCGHVPPLLVRADGTEQRLASTTTVLGSFLTGKSPIEKIKLHPGDLLVICTDGVTEAPNKNLEEYGEERLARAIHQTRNWPVTEILSTIQASVQRFSGATQRMISL